jgi:ATP-binding cassette subfamily F protein uup
MLRQQAAAPARVTRLGPMPKPRAAKRTAPATPLRARSRARRDLDRLIGRIEALGAEIARLEGELGDPELFRRDPGTFDALSGRLAGARTELDAAEQRWLDLAQQLEQVAD